MIILQDPFVEATNDVDSFSSPPLTPLVNHVPTKRSWPSIHAMMTITTTPTIKLHLQTVMLLHHCTQPTTANVTPSPAQPSLLLHNPTMTLLPCPTYPYTDARINQVQTIKSKQSNPNNKSSMSETPSSSNNLKLVAFFRIAFLPTTRAI